MQPHGDHPLEITHQVQQPKNSLECETPDKQIRCVPSRSLTRSFASQTRSISFEHKQAICALGPRISLNKIFSRAHLFTAPNKSGFSIPLPRMDLLRCCSRPGAIVYVGTARENKMWWEIIYEPIKRFLFLIVGDAEVGAVAHEHKLFADLTIE